MLSLSADFDSVHDLEEMVNTKANCEFDVVGRSSLDYQSIQLLSGLESCLAVMKNDGLSRRVCHLSLSVCYVQELVNNGVVILNWVGTADCVADLSAKILRRKSIFRRAENLGAVDVDPPESWQLSPKKFNTLHRRGFGMEDFPKRFKISIRDLKCKKNVLNENLSNNQLKKSQKISKNLKKSRNISKNLEGIKGKIILTNQKISKNLEISRKISKHEKICKNMQKHNFTCKLERDMTAAVSCVQLLG